MSNDTALIDTEGGQRLRISAQDVWDNLHRMEKQVIRAMDCLFPSGWQRDDAAELGPIIEGVVETMAKDQAENAELKRLLDPIKDHDRRMLRGVVERLKQSDGEGWAVGDMLESALLLLASRYD